MGPGFTIANSRHNYSIINNKQTNSLKLKPEEFSLATLLACYPLSAEWIQQKLANVLLAFDYYILE